MEITKFKKDMSRYYISSFFVEELRNVFTERERRLHLKKPPNSKQKIQSCEPDWPVCFTSLEQMNRSEHQQKYYVFRHRDVLSNLKFHHFYRNDRRGAKASDVMVVSTPTEDCSTRLSALSTSDGLQRISDLSSVAVPKEFDAGDLLIERQEHNCKHRLPEEERRRALLKRRAHLLEQMEIIQEDIVDKSIKQLQRFGGATLRSRRVLEEEEEERQEEEGDRPENGQEEGDWQGAMAKGLEGKGKGVVNERTASANKQGLMGVKSRSNTANSQHLKRHSLGDTHLAKLIGTGIKDGDDNHIFGEELFEEEEDLSGFRKHRYSILDKGFDKLNILQFVQQHDSKLNIS